MMERKVALKKVEPEIKIVRASAAGKAVTAALILASVDEQGLWAKHLLSEDEKVSLDALKYLSDKRDGKAKQSLDVKATHEMSARTEDELSFFVANGCWPEDVVAADA